MQEQIPQICRVQVCAAAKTSGPVNGDGDESDATAKVIQELRSDKVDRPAGLRGKSAKKHAGLVLWGDLLFRHVVN